MTEGYFLVSPTLNTSQEHSVDSFMLRQEYATLTLIIVLRPDIPLTTSNLAHHTGQRTIPAPDRDIRVRCSTVQGSESTLRPDRSDNHCMTVTSEQAVLNEGTFGHRAIRNHPALGSTPNVSSTISYGTILQATRDPRVPSGDSVEQHPAVIDSRMSTHTRALPIDFPATDAGMVGSDSSMPQESEIVHRRTSRRLGGPVNPAPVEQ